MVDGSSRGLLYAAIGLPEYVERFPPGEPRTEGHWLVMSTSAWLCLNVSFEVSPWIPEGSAG
jgi:hypothetical protein